MIYYTTIVHVINIFKKIVVFQVIWIVMIMERLLSLEKTVTSFYLIMAEGKSNITTEVIMWCTYYILFTHV